ncbi:response regulator [Vulgatibacter sp.]|uniref:response regulator n=1 Tax=Vulgatibacter sp. TaxID=1971226 RepID=UPI0035680AC8
MARVLLIDDDRELLEVLGEWLVCRGHAVRLLADGFQAPEEAHDFGPDVVLLDGLLRGTTGPAVAERLRAGGHRGIIYLSGLPRGQLPRDVPVIEKPIDLDALDRTIAQMVA